MQTVPCLYYTTLDWYTEYCCECRTVASMQAFQARDASSILATRTMISTGQSSGFYVPIPKLFRFQHQFYSDGLQYLHSRGLCYIHHVAQIFQGRQA